MSNIWEKAAYVPGDGARVDEAWQNGRIVLDANVLVGLYRVRKKTCEVTIRVLEAVKDRLWLPYQCASEFARNRSVEIDAQVNKITVVREALASGIEGLRASLNDPEIVERHALVDPTTFMAAVDKAGGDFRRKLEKWEKEILALQEVDPTWNRLQQLLQPLTGPAPTQATVDKLEAEGTVRYAKAIPPGFKDAAKKSTGYDALGLKIDGKFGDLAIWYEILDLIGREKLHQVIFVTDDEKEDWWLKVSGKRRGPHPSLIGEARLKYPAFETLVFTSSARFIERMGQLYGVAVEADALQEVEDAATEKRQGQRLLNRDRNPGAVLAFEFWLIRQARFDLFEPNVAFPDYVGVEESTGRRVGIEFKFLANPRYFHVEPIVKQVRTRGELAVDRGEVDQIELYIAAADWDGVREVRRGLTASLNFGSIAFRVVIGIIERRGGASVFMPVDGD